MTPPQISFLDSLSVTPAADGLVAVTVLLSPDLVRDYCHFLEALAGFFHTVERKAKINRAHLTASSQAVQKADGELRLTEYNTLLTASFDSYVASGLDRKEAVKRVSADLRAVNHPWSSFELVRSQLVKLGRGGHSGRRRVQP